MARIPTGWSNADTKTPSSFSNADVKSRTPWGNADTKTPGNWTPASNTPSKWSNPTFTYDDSFLTYDTFGGGLYDGTDIAKPATAWLPV